MNRITKTIEALELDREEVIVIREFIFKATKSMTMDDFTQGVIYNFLDEAEKFK